MNNSQENKKLNDKGFSLVELIIVIAIMAVLVGVLAPQYLQYVERSRNSTDRDNCAAIESAVQVYGADGTYAKDSTGTTITVSQSSTEIAFAGTNADALKAALNNAGISTSTYCVSRTAWTSYVITVTVDDNGIVKVSNNLPSSTTSTTSTSTGGEGEG